MGSRSAFECCTALAAFWFPRHPWMSYPRREKVNVTSHDSPMSSQTKIRCARGLNCDQNRFHPQHELTLYLIHSDCHKLEKVQHWASFQLLCCWFHCKSGTHVNKGCGLNWKGVGGGGGGGGYSPPPGSAPARSYFLTDCHTSCFVLTDWHTIYIGYRRRSNYASLKK